MTCLENPDTRHYFPLHNHFEQQIHVRHRLDRHHAGMPLDYDAATPDRVAHEMLAALSQPTTYRPVTDNGATRAATLISSLL